MGIRVFRGGSFWLVAWNCRSASRFRDGPGFRFESLGFRPVAEMKEIEPRGGYWNWNAWDCRSAHRSVGEPEDRGNALGFRPVAENVDGS